MNESPSATWPRMRVRDLIDRHFSGPSPTCEERQMSSVDEWGLLKTTAVTWDGWNELAHKVPPKEFWGRASIEVRSGDVLVTKAGPRHRVGVVVCVAETRPRLMVSGKMIGLRPKRSVVLPQVLNLCRSTWIHEQPVWLNRKRTLRTRRC
jgi:type I restriction enzyme S subunit